MLQLPMDYILYGMVWLKENSMSIIETNFGTRLDPKRVALGSATNVTKKGAFYVFSLRVDTDDVREYSFSNRDRAVAMRNVLISHLEKKVIFENRKRA